MSTPIKFLDAPRPCSVCGLPTVTKKIGKGMRVPMHVTCDKRPVEPIAVEEVVDVLVSIANVMGPVTVIKDPGPVRVEDVGPCVKCRRPARRYGPDGSAFCHRCNERVLALTDQLHLFPITVCPCGHRWPALDGDGDRDPCPACLTQSEDAHDCPLTEESS